VNDGALDRQVTVRYGVLYYRYPGTPTRCTVHIVQENQDWTAFLQFLKYVQLLGHLV